MDNRVNYKLGHRGRVKERFLREGTDAFAEYEILELLLFYAVPRRDTKGMAHALMDAFGDLNSVLTASAEALCSVAGIGEHTAVFLRSILPFMAFVMKEEEQPKAFENDDEMGVFFVDFFRKHPDVSLVAAFLNNRRAPIRILPLADGSKNFESAPVQLTSLVNAAFRANAPGVVVAYRKKDGVAFPSPAVIESLRFLEENLSGLGISLTEAVCVVGTQYNLLLRFLSGSVCRAENGDTVKSADGEITLPPPSRALTREKLSLFLSSFMNQESTEQTTELLLREYPSLLTLLSIPYAALTEEGIPSSIALLLKLIPGVYARAKRAEAGNNRNLYSIDSLGNFFADYLGARSEEVLALAMFDERKRLIDVFLSGNGTVNISLFVQRNLLQEALASRAKYVALAHNHPLGSCVPSSMDASVTASVRRVFEGVGITFLEHFVVNEKEYYPILANGGETLADFGLDVACVSNKNGDDE